MWSEIVTTALIGTERQKLKLTQNSESPLMQLLDRIDSSNGEKQLLDVAATVALYRRAGSLPAQLKSPQLPPCDLDDLPVCNDRVAYYLDRVIGAVHKEILQELLQAIAQAGKRVPDSSLMTLLVMGRQNRALRKFIIPVLGKRGRWLAGHNPQWHYVGRAVPDGTAATEIWQIGDRATRAQLLKDLRASDPAFALNLITTSWQNEPADERSDFIEALEINLTIDDESFLETALDDRRKEVRKQAANLVKRLDKSRYIERMIARVEPLLKFSRTGDKAALEIELPEQCDKAMQRDGIEPKPDYQHKQLSERGWWLQQMLSTIPPRYWCNLWQVTPKELISLIRDHDWRGLLVDSWSEAIQLHADREWAEALLDEGVLKTWLLQSLSSEFIEDLIDSLLNSEPLQSQRLLWLLGNYKSEWSERLSHRVIEKIREHITLCSQLTSGSYAHDWALQNDFKLFALYIPAKLYDEFWREWPREADYWPQWSETVDQFLSLLKLRQEMVKEINR